MRRPRRRLEDEAREEIARLRQQVAALTELARHPDIAPYQLRRQAIVDAARARRFREPELAAQVLVGQEGDPRKLVGKLADENPYLREPDMNELIRAGRKGRARRSA